MPHDLFLRHVPLTEKLTIGDQIAVFSVHNCNHFFRTFYGLFVFSQLFLRQLAFSDIQRHAEHSFGVTVPSIVELASRCQPANCPIWLYDTKLCRAQLPVLPCIRDRFRDSSSVIRMYVTNEILLSCHVRIGSDSEDSLKVAEPNIPSAFDVKVPPCRCARFHCQT